MNTVRLIDGTEVDSSSEAWRAECEARHVLNMHGKPARYAYLTRVESKRGKVNRDALEAGVMGLWRAGRDKGD